MAKIAEKVSYFKMKKSGIATAKKSATSSKKTKDSGGTSDQLELKKHVAIFAAVRKYELEIQSGS